MDDAALLVAARRTYELGRLRRALSRAAIGLPAAAIPIAQCASVDRAAEAFAAAGAVLVLVVLFLWRGEGYGRGARTGAVAGLAPLLVPTLASATGVLCSATVCGVLPVAAVGGGVLAGLILGGDALRAERRGPAFWFAAVAVTCALGAIGCLHVGLAGLGGMALGVLAGSAPVLCWRAARVTR